MVGRVELRAGNAAEGSIGSIEGVAAVVGKETVIGSGFYAFREVIMPGAFKDAVKSDDVRALFNHDPNLLLGRTASQTLRVREDKSGLRYDVDLPDTVTGRDVQTLIRRGDVSGSSFAFTVDEADEEWDDTEIKNGKLPLRKVNRISTLYDVSPVTYPAYPTTSVSARSLSRAKAANVRAAAAPSDAPDAEEQAELIQYRAADELLAQAGVSIASAQALMTALIAAETSDVAADEDDEEEIESAQLASLLALSSQICGTMYSVNSIVRNLLSEDGVYVGYYADATVEATAKREQVANDEARHAEACRVIEEAKAWRPLA